jgi:chemotaxis signal transduction protein
MEIAGVINVRGEPLPAFNAGVLLGDDPTPAPRHTLVLEHGAMRVGVLVDAVSRIESPGGLERAEPAEAPRTLPHPDLVRWRMLDGIRIGLVDPDVLLGRVGDLLARPVQHIQDKGESWPNAF